MTKTSRRKIYDSVFQTTRNIINYVDPEGLEPGKEDGSPIDEYEIEVAPITAFIINNRQSLEEDYSSLAEEIDRIWKKYFDRDCPGSTEIAKEIVQQLSEIN